MIPMPFPIFCDIVTVEDKATLYVTMSQSWSARSFVWLCHTSARLHCFSMLKNTLLFVGPRRHLTIWLQTGCPATGERQNNTLTGFLLGAVPQHWQLSIKDQCHW